MQQGVEKKENLTYFVNTLLTKAQPAGKRFIKVVKKIKLNIRKQTNKSYYLIMYRVCTMLRFFSLIKFTFDKWYFQLDSCFYLIFLTITFKRMNPKIEKKTKCEFSFTPQNERGVTLCRHQAIVFSHSYTVHYRRFDLEKYRNMYGGGP